MEGDILDLCLSMPEFSGWEWYLFVSSQLIVPLEGENDVPLFVAELSLMDCFRGSGGSVDIGGIVLTV